MKDSEHLSRPDIAAAILSGGRSRRMGEPKDAVELWDGRPMIEHVKAALCQVCPTLLIVTAPERLKERTAGDEGAVRFITDIHPGLGPLAGIEAVLASGISSGYLIAACDQPLITPSLLESLLPGSAQPASQARFFCQADGAVVHPFPAYLSESCLPAVREALEWERRSVKALIEHLPATFLPLSPEQEALLESLNSKADIASALRNARL